MRPRPKMIVLVGVDGSGKSTAAKWLARELTASGTPARYFENGGGRPVIDPLARRLGRRDGRHLLGPRGYLAVEALIRWIAMSLAVTTSMLARRVAVMDRYAYCQYAIMRARGDSARREGDEGDEAGGRAERLVRALYSVFPRPDVTFYLAVPADEAARRVEARGRDLEDPAYLAAFDAAYRSLPEFPTFTEIDASVGVDPVAAALRDHLATLR
ncbi:thymidylate kinase [Pseudofrankia sp. BMG5.37]|uniref:dTMP kinase n=1 Tax=Pseudofrankia sp. BMG5.37 TaxID=3050035 RepID=UPI00289580E0|nr:thymidylate kinase [Pseudofrankia sp. BMG5.37]MDT3444343.1 thymidylate kinase [Pseudofrankia sp. BMG5.37]